MKFEPAMHQGLRVCGLTNFSRMACFLVLGIVLYGFILIGGEIKSMLTSFVCLQELLLPHETAHSCFSLLLTTFIIWLLGEDLTVCLKKQPNNK